MSVKNRSDQSGMGTPRSIETRNQIHARMPLQRNKTKDETAFEKRFTRETRIEDGSCGSLQTIEIGSDFLIGVTLIGGTCPPYGSGSGHSWRPPWNPLCSFPVRIVLYFREIDADNVTYRNSIAFLDTNGFQFPQEPVRVDVD
jgi:hypothetical protein